MPENAAEPVDLTNTRLYKVLLGLGYAGIISILLYEGFNLESAYKGLNKLDEIFTGGDTDGFPTFAIVFSVFSVLLETGTNLTMVSPRIEVNRLLRITDQPVPPPGDGLLADEPVEASALVRQPVVQLPKLVVCKPFSLLNFNMVMINALNAGFASVLPVNTALGGVNGYSVPLMGVFGLLSIVYQVFLVGLDSVEAYQELRKGRDSVFWMVCRVSKAQFARSIIESITTCIYYSIVTSYMMRVLCEEVFQAPELTLWFQVPSVTSTVFMLLPRLERLFTRWLAPFRDGDKYNIHRFTEEDRDEVWRELTFCKKAALSVGASAYSVFVMATALYFTDKYIAQAFDKNLHRHIINVVLNIAVGGAVFFSVNKTNMIYTVNEQVATHRFPPTTSTTIFDSSNYSRLVRLFATAFNIGSQTTRSICAVTFFESEFKGILPQLDSVVLSVIVASIVTTTNFQYYRPKLHRSLDQYGESLSRFFRKREDESQPDVDEEKAYELLSTPRQ